jgi:hypothetical protein
MSTPRAFETGEVTGFTAAKTDGPTSTTIRVTRTTKTHPPTEVVYSIGTGRLTATGMQMGFLLRSDTVTGVQVAVPLELYFPSNGTSAVLTLPQAVLVMGTDNRTVVVVGGGMLNTAACADLVGPSRTVDDPPLPAIAVVNTATMCVARLQVGNSDPTFGGEVYNDIALDPWCCTGSSWLVASTGLDPDLTTTLLRRVSMDTLMPEPVGPAGDLYTTPIGAPTYSRLNDKSTASVSLATLSNMVVVGAHVQDPEADTHPLQSFLWVVTPRTLQVLVPATTTSYNDPATGRLPLVADTASLVLLRVFALPDDGLVVVARGYVAEDSVDLSGGAVCTVQVLRYTQETTLDVGFAVNGVLVWYNQDVVGGTYPMDAALVTSQLAPAGTVLVVGNSFFSGASGASPMHYTVPGFTFGYLDVTSAYEPIPFAVEVKGYVCGTGTTGAPPALVRPLFTQMCGCASHWASSVAPTSAISLVVMGDSWFHLGCPAQSAFIFDVAVGVGGRVPWSSDAAEGGGGGGSSFVGSAWAGSARRRGHTRTGPGPGPGPGYGPLPAPCAVQLLNNTPSATPAILVNSCAGVVTVDTLCPPSTTLRVRGPVVVGCLAPCEVQTRAVEGMLRYDPDTHTLQLYNGTEWRVVQTQAPS